MNKDAISAIMRGIAPVIAGYIATAVAPLVERLLALEARVQAKSEKGDTGRGIVDAIQDAHGNLILTFTDGTTKDIGRIKGADADVPGLIERMAALEGRAGIFAERISEIAARKLPDAIPGDPGTPGANATDDQVADAVAKYLAAHPPAPGLPGDPGSPGKAADPVTDAQIADAVAKYIAANPPQPGKPGESIKGDPGVGIKGALIDAEGRLVFTLTDGAVVPVSRVVGRDGVDAKGEPGTHGTGWDDLIVEYDGERTFKFVTVKGDSRKDHGAFVVPLLIYRGVFTDGDYTKGDVVTWAGALWHCNEATSEKPGEGSKAWTLAVKKGRDGKDGVMKPPPPSGPLKL